VRSSVRYQFARRTSLYEAHPSAFPSDALLPTCTSLLLRSIPLHPLPHCVRYTRYLLFLKVFHPLALICFRIGYCSSLSYHRATSCFTYDGTQVHYSSCDLKSANSFRPRAINKPEGRRTNARNAGNALSEVVYIIIFSLTYASRSPTPRRRFTGKRKMTPNDRKPLSIAIVKR